MTCMILALAYYPETADDLWVALDAGVAPLHLPARLELRVCDIRRDVQHSGMASTSNGGFPHRAFSMNRLNASRVVTDTSSTSLLGRNLYLRDRVRVS